MGFRQFGPDHWGVLIFTAAAGFGLVRGAGRIRNAREDRAVRWAWAFGLFASAVSSWVFEWSRGDFILPLQICDVAALFMVWSLLKGGGRYAAELAFFWGLAGSSQALLTPDLKEGFPSVPWFQFFSNHCGVVLAAVYLAARGLFQATAGSALRAWLFLNFYVAAAGFLNWRLGTNFGYLAAKPLHPSLLDYMGPWPHYVLWADLLALGLFFLCLGFGRGVNRLAGFRDSERTRTQGA